MCTQIMLVKKKKSIIAVDYFMYHKHIILPTIYMHYEDCNQYTCIYVQCTVYIHCTVYTVHRTLYTHCTMHSVQCTSYIVCTLYNIHYTMYIVHCTWYNSIPNVYTLYNIQCTMYSVHDTLA